MHFPTKHFFAFFSPVSATGWRLPLRFRAPGARPPHPRRGGRSGQDRDGRGHGEQGDGGHQVQVPLNLTLLRLLTLCRR